MWIYISPDWEAERRTVLVRLVLAALPLLFSLSGLITARLEFAIAVLLVVLAQAGLCLWGIRRRWEGLSTTNYWIQMFVLVLALAGTGGMSGPMAFLAYALVVADILWTKDRLTVRNLALNMIGAVWLGSLWANSLGFNIPWTTLVLHTLGLTFIAWHMIQPLRRLQNEASTDPLTEALNRRSGLATLERWIEGKVPFALIFVDLKGFKKLNDTFGHHVGDLALVTLSQEIRQRLRQDDLLIRYGGDEFVVAATSGGEIILNRLVESLPSTYKLDGRQIQLQLNFGMVSYPGDAQDLETLLHLADTRMYDHKRAENPLTQTTS